MNAGPSPPASTKSLAAVVAAERFHPVENPRVRVPASTLGLKEITLTGGVSDWDVFTGEPIDLGRRLPVPRLRAQATHRRIRDDPSTCHPGDGPNLRHPGQRDPGR
jgi:hypothetical protein